MLSKCLQMQARTSMPSTGQRSSCSVFAALLISIRLGWSAVHWAAGAGHAKCIEALVTAGANISIVASDGTCALHWAAERGHAECVQALLASAADVNVVDRCITLMCPFRCVWLWSRLRSLPQKRKNSVAPCRCTVLPFRIYGQ
jgi:ankyrin repeat protein